MTTLPQPKPPRICARCAFWAKAYVGPQNFGFCTWREDRNKSRQPRMNGGSHYQLADEGKTLETRWDASCLQWEPKADRVKG